MADKALRITLFSPWQLACCAVASVLILVLCAPASLAAEPETFTLNPIGSVQREGERTRIVLQPRFQDGLLGLNEFSHVWVIWWFDRNDTPRQRRILQVHPRADARNPLAGVFATRAPVRPNLLALSLCRIVSVKDNVLEIEGIDAFDDTPVLDLKPYIPSEAVRQPDFPPRY